MVDEPPYWTEPLESEFSIKVDTCKKVEKGFEITLTTNVIRPAGGGQAGDRGVRVQARPQYPPGVEHPVRTRAGRRAPQASG